MMPARLLQPWEVLQIDIQDMKVKSEKGKQYLLVVVDRASKFLAAFPLPNKDALSVSRKLLGLLLTFGLPLSIRADMESENTAQVMQHLCSWLKVSLDYGPVNHPRAQGAVERMGGWLQEALSLLCKAWPKRWDDYVPVATWIHRVTPDPALPGGVSPYQILFGRPPRSHIDLLAQPLDAASFGQGLDRTVVNVLLARLCFTVQLNGRRIRQRPVAAGDVKPFHRRPDHLQHDFEDEYSHLVWSSDLGLQSTSVVAVALYTPTSRRVSQNANGTGAWTWEYAAVTRTGHSQTGSLKTRRATAFRRYSSTSSTLSGNSTTRTPRRAHQESPPEANEKWSPESARWKFFLAAPRSAESSQTPRDDPRRSIKATVYDYCDPYCRLELIIDRHWGAFRRAVRGDSLARVEPMLTTLVPGARAVKARSRTYNPTKTTWLTLCLTTLVAMEMLFLNPQAVWASAAMALEKSGGKHRLVSKHRLGSDFRAVNRTVEKSPAPMPNQEAEMLRMGQATCYGSLAMWQGYWQMPLAPESQQMFTIASPGGLITPTLVPQGVLNATSDFQATMTSLQEGLNCKVWVDDVICWGHDEDLLQTLELILGR
eukprot:g2117.t1